jgi:hypothetical protein
VVGVAAQVGSMTLVANIFFAHFWLGETLSWRDIVVRARTAPPCAQRARRSQGTVMILSGAATAVAFGDKVAQGFDTHCGGACDLRDATAQTEVSYTVGDLKANFAKTAFVVYILVMSASLPPSCARARAGY